ncbi:MAG: hypothetical protein FWC01_08905 [Treponema sp.]|nr:hypothetical protein [Treponema sp.]MCL2238093.1 hypothetical protein [Treponema sp.]
MGVIKTALEIALERTETVKSDRAGIDLFEAKQRGKKLANAFLAGEADLAKEIKKCDLKDSLKQGIFDVLLAQINLPAKEEDEVKLKKAGEGFKAIVKHKDFEEMYNSFMLIVSQYIGEASQYDKLIRKQYEPKLKQKEEEMSRRMGREVRLDPMQDPEFVAFYNQNVNALKGKYEPVVEQAREAVTEMFKI